MMATKRTVRTAKERATSKRSSRAAKAVEPKGVNAPTHDQIAMKAYEIWIAHGCPEGQAQKNWHEAEVKLTLDL